PAARTVTAALLTAATAQATGSPHQSTCHQRCSAPRILANRPPEQPRRFRYGEKTPGIERIPSREGRHEPLVLSRLAYESAVCVLASSCWERCPSPRWPS